MNKRNIPWLVLLFLIACVVFLLLFFFIRTGFNTEGVLSIFSPETATITPDTSTNDNSSPSIPGLSREQITVSLTGAGYECTEPEIGDLGLLYWVCWKTEDQNLLEIYFFSRTTQQIDFIDANINQVENPSDERAIEFLTYVGNLPDTDAGEELGDWIAETLPDIKVVRDLRVNDFGGIHYRLYGTAEARSLEVGILPIAE